MRGRWTSIGSARHYIQQGPALALTRETPPEVTALAERLRPHLAVAIFQAAIDHRNAARKRNRPTRRRLRGGASVRSGD
jgi:hypothetical protein